MSTQQGQQVLDLANMHCPHCDHLTDDATYAGEEEILPAAGDPTICGHCTGIGVYTEDSIRKATDEEIAEYELIPEFKAALGAAKVMALLTGAGLIQEGIEIPGHEGHRHRGVIIGMGEGEDMPEGAIDISKLPDQLREAIESQIERAKVDRMAEEIRQFVTPEIAHHVLYVMGDGEATAPSLAVDALIMLIRTAAISDDRMTTNLNGVEDFHGYVLAVHTFGDPMFDEHRRIGGMTMLRKIAGLDTDGPVKKS